MYAAAGLNADDICNKIQDVLFNKDNIKIIK